MIGGETGDANQEASRRGSLGSSPALLSVDIAEPSPPESAAPAAVARFPRSLDDSNAIPLPQAPGPRKMAARRRAPGAPPPAPPVGPAAKEVEGEADGTDESTLLDLRFARPPESDSGVDTEDGAVTTLFRAPSPGAVKPAPAAPAPKFASPPEVLARSARPPTVEAIPSPSLGASAPFDALGPGSEPADLPPWTTAELYGSFTGSRWIPKRVRSITPRVAVAGAMAVAATLLLAVGFVAAAGGSPAPEPENLGKPQGTSEEIKAAAPSAPLAPPAAAPAPSPRSAATTAPTTSSEQPLPAAKKPKPPQASKGVSSPPRPKCQGKLIKKC